MDLLALIGFPKSIGYEFKAQEPLWVSNHNYSLYIYVKRPGTRFWKVCRSVGSYGSYVLRVSYNKAIKLIDTWVEDPRIFEQYHNNYIRELIDYKNRSKRMIIIKKENVQATKMKRALE